MDHRFHVFYTYNFKLCLLGTGGRGSREDMEKYKIVVSKKSEELVKQGSFSDIELEEMKGYVRVFKPKIYFFVDPPLALEQVVNRLKELEKRRDKQSRIKIELIKQLLKDNRVYSEYVKHSISRDPREIEVVFRYNVSMLEHLCKEFDKGKIESALWIAVILRTLIHTHYNEKEKKYTSLSILYQLGKKGITFLSSSFPQPKSSEFLQGWDISNISNTTMTSVSIFAGLLIKKLKTDKRGKFSAEFMPMLDKFSPKNKFITRSEWMKEVVFMNPSEKISMTRWDVIKMIANKDGGAHFDPNVPPTYEAFRSNNLFKIRCNDIEVKCTHNPVYVSIRQIAWEVLETFKHYNLIK